MRVQRVKHYERAEFPGVVAVIDGTELRIKRPGRGPQTAHYSGHKKLHTIKALAAVTTDDRFCFVDVSKPGECIRPSPPFHRPHPL